ncbi:hypothetical protein M413DRAFT_10575 [Hebeloma cylindrosporum]|uniref:Fungal-type protein kinase domain-containing protein n=1 Tax=Hebeloma cylindrosporum TaxID=76867 RepID=A0A0C3CE13_HEBCY|nr:hypothetical protein M413DRAFT_10575 [Hebeloma cylindrosporum h7]
MDWCFQRVHPSNAINDLLLKETPGAEVAITEDANWMPLITEKMDIDDTFWDSKFKSQMESLFALHDPALVRVWKSRCDGTPEWEGIKVFAEFSTIKKISTYRKGGPTHPEGGYRTAENVLSSHWCTPDLAVSAGSTALKRQSDAVETFAHVCDRSCVTGLFFDVGSVSLWYFDRNAVIRTISVDFLSEGGIKYLALVLFALNQCDMQHAGFNPFFKSLVDRGRRESDSYFDFIPLTRPDDYVDDLCLVFPKTPKDKTSDTRFFIIEAWVDGFSGVIGDGTNTLVVREGWAKGFISGEYQALKMGWLPVSQPHESELVYTLRRQVSEWRDHLPQLHYCKVFSAEDVGIPWTKMNIVPASNRVIEEKALHVSVMKDYRTLWEVRSIENFKAVFLDCLECHYHAYNTGGVLHGAISEKSLVWWKPERDVVYKRGALPVGILTRWEVGPCPREDHDIPNPLEIGNGAGPFAFLATELLAQNTKHYYRHDLESFFYILIWSCVHYDVKDKHHDLVNPYEGIKGWLYKDTAQRTKTRLIHDWEAFMRIESLVKADFQDLFSEWVVPLRKLFKTALESIPDNPVEEGYDLRTCNGILTFEAFMDAIGEAPKGLNRPPIIDK